jgi:hypothetical protein
MSGLYAHVAESSVVKRDVQEALKKLFQDSFPDRTLHQTGSSVHRLGLRTCDLDLVLTPNSLAVDILARGRKEMEKSLSRLRQLIYPLKTRIAYEGIEVRTAYRERKGEIRSVEFQNWNPILLWKMDYFLDDRLSSFLPPEQPLDIDVSFGDASSYYMSLMLRYYRVVHPVLAYAARTILLWARAYNIIDTKNNRMNSVTWVTLVIHFAIKRGMIKMVPTHLFIRLGSQALPELRERIRPAEEDAIEIHKMFVVGFFRVPCRKKPPHLRVRNLGSDLLGTTGSRARKGSTSHDGDSTLHWSQPLSRHEAEERVPIRRALPSSNSSSFEEGGDTGCTRIEARRNSVSNSANNGSNQRV